MAVKPPRETLTAEQLAELLPLLSQVGKRECVIAIAAVARRMKEPDGPRQFSAEDLAASTGVSLKTAKRSLPVLEQKRILVRTVGDHARHEPDRWGLAIENGGETMTPPSRAGPEDEEKETPSVCSAIRGRREGVPTFPAEPTDDKEAFHPKERNCYRL